MHSPFPTSGLQFETQTGKLCLHTSHSAFQRENFKLIHGPFLLLCPFFPLIPPHGDVTGVK